MENKNKTCFWDNVDYAQWDSECGEKVMYLDADPKDRNYNFCPYCGLKIKLENKKDDSRNN